MSSGIKHFFLMFLYLWACIGYGQTDYNFKASNYSFSSKDTLVEIDFDIKNFKKYDVFNVSLTCLDNKQKSYKVNSLINSKNLKGGENSILWNPLSDGYKLDGQYKINLEIAKSSKIKIPYKKHLVHSVILPGWGDRNLRNGKGYLLIGALAYGSLFSFLDYNSKANNNYNAYKNSYNVEQSNTYFINAKKQNNISYILAGISAITWTADLYFLRKRIKKVKSNPTISKFYNKKQNRIYKTNEGYKYLNTKKKAEKYLDSAIVEFNNKNYGLAKAYFQATKTYPISDSLISNNIDNYINLSTIEIDFSMNYKNAILNLTKLHLNSAKSSLLKAQKIKPYDSIVRLKLDSINSYEKFYSVAENYYINKKFQKALENYKISNFIFNTNSTQLKISLTEQEIIFISLITKGDNFRANKEYEKAIKSYNSALKIKPNNTSLNTKVDQVSTIIAKINNDNSEYKRLLKEGKILKFKEQYDQALLKFNSALNYKANDYIATNYISQINDYFKLLKNGDIEFKNTNYKIALNYYTQANLQIESSVVKEKIKKSNVEIKRNNLINDGLALFKNKNYKQAFDKYEEAKSIRSTTSLELKIQKANKAICDEIIKVADNLKAAKKWKEALVKYEEVNALCPSSNIKSSINVVKNEIKKMIPGEKIVNKKWYEIYNQNGFKVELLFEIKKGLCVNDYAVIYIEYRYTGKVSNLYSNKYINWSVEYERCDKSKWKFIHAVQVSGDLFKQPSNQNPNYMGSNFSTPKKIKIMNESIKAGNDNIYFDVKSVRESWSKDIFDRRK